MNGAGKSTLLKCICGDTEPSQERFDLGHLSKRDTSVNIRYGVLDPNATVEEQMRVNLSQASDGYIRNLLAAFLFRGDDVKKKIKHLSGRKISLSFGGIFSSGNNLLVLDEPTNHLDIKSREILMDALKRYEGTVLFVSHDRHFLHEIAGVVMEVK